MSIVKDVTESGGAARFAGIRLAGAADVDVLAAVHAVAFPPLERWDAAAFAALLATPGCCGVVAEGGLALLRIAGDEAEVLTLAVAPGWRRLGLGRRLLSAGLGEAARGGAAAALLEVAPNNVAARQLYAAAGFAEVGRRRAYYPDGGDALVLRLERPGGETAEMMPAAPLADR